RMRAGQSIFTYFHFAADEKLTKAHIDSGATCVAYETVELPTRELPLLTPMSEVAGRMAVQEGAKYLEKLYGGRGVLLGGVPGVPPAKVVILGGGIVGINAAKMAAVWRRSTPPRTRIRPTSSTASSTMAWQICRAEFPARRRSRSPTRRCRTRCSWRTRAGRRRCATTRRCSRG